MAEKGKKSHSLVLRLSLILFGFLLIIIVELLLRALTPPAPACKEDPFVGFAGEETLFIQTEKHGKGFYELNPRRAKFFNKETFPAEKGDDTFRAFMLGGSVAMGFPFHEPGSFSRFLEVGLRGLDPSGNYEVINAGGFGYASYRVTRILREVINYDPDMIVVMTGHNEFLEKRTYGEMQDESPGLVSLKTWLSKFRIYCLLKSAVFRVRGQDARPLLSGEVTWERYVRDPVQTSRTLKHYEYNLQEMASICQEAGVPLFMVTLPSNLRDFPPYRSEHGSELSEDDLGEWKKAYWKGIQGINKEEWDRALGYLTLAEKIDPLYAEVPFMTGRVLCEKKDWLRASDKFWRSVRLDAWPMRAFEEMNRMIRDQSRNEGIFIVDAEKYFSDKSEGGIPGDDWFLDHCHPDLDGNIAIARSIISGMVSEGLIRLPQDWAQTYNDICEDYRDNLPDYWLAEAYYRAAFETGMNVKRLERGLRLAGRAKQHDPSNPKISTLIHNLSILRESGP